ncbi:MAG: cation transporter [Gammaproteobacteria bacterium]|nr:cation transporter [Gammaproteobacteria bacterium]MDH5730149.1 cation transporter [Gammaproteobacteria bacterium]
MSDCGCDIEVKNREQSRVLILLLLINFGMFLFEIVFGLIAQSTALIADSLDMLADATVYAIAWVAVGRSVSLKIKAARVSGLLQITLGLMVLSDVVRRFFIGSEPQSLIMFAIGTLALLANIICLGLIAKHRQGEVHMRASWIFSKNDVIANLGILLAAGLVYLFESNWPDLLVGAVVAIVVIRGGIQILRESNNP